jgi:ParB family chromosome partitioning protein
MAKTAMHMTVNIPLSKIEIGLFSPRKTFNKAYVNELAESIELQGLLKPLTVRLGPDDSDRYQLLDGEHRFRALKLKNITLARCEVVAANNREALTIAFTTNDLHGKKLDPIEEASHIKRMMTDEKLTQQEIGTVLRKKQSWVSKRLSLIENLEPSVQERIIRRRINPSHAEELMSLEKPLQKEIADKIEDEKLSSRQTRVLTSAIKSHPEKTQEILEKPVAPFGVLVSTSEQLKEALEAAPEQAAVEIVRCPYCNGQLWVNWFGHDICIKQETD